MPNILKMEKQALIQQLLSLGWSYRRIQKETGIHRTTISKYDPSHPSHKFKSQSSSAKDSSSISTNDEFNNHKVPTGSGSGFQNRPKCPPTDFAKKSSLTQCVPGGLSKSTPLKKPTRVSQAQAYDKIIREKLRHDLSAQRIYQDLVVEHGFPHSYDSVKRYVAKLKETAPKVFARIHTAPGEEAQVDFGQAAPTLKNGRYIRPWFFKIVLSFSRHSYEETVWAQDVETFIRCHEHAFESFGGVPKLIRIDYVPRNIINIMWPLLLCGVCSVSL